MIHQLHVNVHNYSSKVCTNSMFHVVLLCCSAIPSTISARRVVATVRATGTRSAAKHGSHGDDEHQYSNGIVDDRGDGEADSNVIEHLASVPLLSRCSIAKRVSL